ncbi:amino acid adenylation domain-containing protein [Lyngbya sp. CCY1209]|uniref:non-ribosomal peptide synthetase n=1 Tax=Lyngbya sp. CCY1209 TaxID=2886103 RepID=UPI0035C8A1C1
MSHDCDYLIVGLDGSNPYIRHRRERTPIATQKLALYFTTKGGAIPRDTLENIAVRDRFGTPIPCQFYRLEELPLTAAGDIDREALERRQTEGDRVYPSTETERQIARIWESILGVSRIAIHDNFFELGGTSILATQMISRMRQELAIDLTLRQLFESPTVADLVAQIQTQITRTARAIEATDRPDTIPLSFTQQRLWFLAQLEPESTAYHLSAVYRLRGSLNQTALEKSFNHIVARHETLRTALISRGGQPVQVISPNLTLPLETVDLRDQSETEQKIKIEAALARTCETPFNFDRPPLMGTTLVRLSPSEHILIVAIHHIISDGWSMGILMGELGQLYAHHDRGEPLSLPELSVQYADFALWQRRAVEGEIAASQLAYWQEKLGGNLPVLELPTDYPRPPVQTFSGKKETRSLSPSSSRALKTFSQQQGVTPFMTLLATFQLLLSRHAGQEDLVVGTPIAGRNQVEVEPLIGFFVNTLVLRNQLSGNSRFKDLLNQIRSATLDAYANQDVPFEKLVEVLHPDRDLSYSPIFQVWFNSINLGDRNLKLPGLEVEPLTVPETHSLFDLNFYIREQPDRLKLELVYNADLFGRERMYRMLEAFEYLLGQVLETPELKVDEFSLLPPSARPLLPDPTRPPTAAWEGPLSTQFSQMARQIPQKIAVADAEGSWTYQALETRSNQLARALVEAGVSREDIVAIYADRAASLVAAILGVFKANAAFLILDPTYPGDRLVTCLHLANPKALIRLPSAPDFPPQLAEATANFPALSHLIFDEKSLANYPGDPPDIESEPDDLAYIAFTSGSTGVPKGILGTHRPLAHFIRWHVRQFQLTAEDRFSLLSGLAHDPLLRDIFTPLTVGGTLEIPKADDIYSPDILSEWMRSRQIGVAHLTPALSQLLAEMGDRARLPDLRYLFFGGEKLKSRDIEKVRKLAPSATCVNFYGATETPQAMSYFVIPETGKGGNIPVGRGIDGVQLLVLNGRGRLAGIGEIGEICIRTPYLAKGYLNDETLTRERFIENPFTQIPGDRLYKTGDLGYYQPDGNVEFFGRKDRQVKIRGFRVEMGEIEAALSQYPHIDGVAVTCRESEAGDPTLTAYLASNSAPPDPDRLRQFLKGKLPNYMIPATFVNLDALPLTPNQKIDYRALPIPDSVAIAPTSDSLEPRDELELKLTEIWRQVLNNPAVGIRDNFFDVGGHSLLSVKLFSDIQAAFNKTLPLATLFHAPTIERLADILRQRGWTPTWKALVPIQPRGSKPPIFAVHPLKGGVFYYRDLARNLGTDYPFYGLAAQFDQEGQILRRKIEEIAAFYVQEIRQIRPEGPYFLAGMSFGGRVAFEIAQQLTAAGCQVGLLIMFDTTAPGAIKYLPPQHRISGHLQRLLRRGPGYLWERVKYRLGWLRRQRRSRQVTAELTRQRNLSIADQNLAIEAANLEAMKAHVPRPYAGQITLFRAADRQAGLGRTIDPQLGWEELALGGVDIIEVPGHHLSILTEPNVKILAEKLRDRIDRSLES